MKIVFSRKSMLAVFTFALMVSPVMAAQISYTLEDLGQGRWKADYTVQNSGLQDPIREFTIWFDYGLYSNLIIETLSPLNTAWNERIYEPYQQPPLTPFNGYYDALATGNGIDPDQFINGFTLTFDWLGTGQPTGQQFEVLNPQTFETLAEGETVYIPEPACWLLVLTGGIYLKKKLKR